jgi:hypothetical protein
VVALALTSRASSSAARINSDRLSRNICSMSTSASLASGAAAREDARLAWRPTFSSTISATLCRSDNEKVQHRQYQYSSTIRRVETYLVLC